MSRYADVVRTSRFGSDCPGLGRLAVMANAGFPEAVLEMGEVQAIAKTLGIEVSSLEIKRPDDIPPAFDAIRGAPPMRCMSVETRSYSATAWIALGGPRVRSESDGPRCHRPAAAAPARTTIPANHGQCPRDFPLMWSVVIIIKYARHRI